MHVKAFIIGCIFITSSASYGMTVADEKCQKIASLGLTLAKDEPIPNRTLGDDFLSGIDKLKTNNPQDARNYFNKLIEDDEITIISHGYYYFLVAGLMLGLIDAYDANETTMQTGLYKLQHTSHFVRCAQAEDLKYLPIKEASHYHLIKIISEHKLPIIDWYVEPGAPQFLQRQINPMDGALHKKNCAILIKIARSFPSSKTIADDIPHRQKFATGIASLTHYNIDNAIKNFTEAATIGSNNIYLAIQATLMLSLINGCSHDAQQHETGLWWLQTIYKYARTLFSSQNKEMIIVKANQAHNQQGDPNSDFYPIIWQTAAQQLIAFGKTTEA